MCRKPAGLTEPQLYTVAETAAADLYHFPFLLTAPDTVDEAMHPLYKPHLPISAVTTHVTKFHSVRCMTLSVEASEKVP